MRSFEWPVPGAATTAWLPLVDVFEEPDVIRLVAEVPGVKPEDVKRIREQTRDRNIFYMVEEILKEHPLETKK